MITFVSTILIVQNIEKHLGITIPVFHISQEFPDLISFNLSKVNLKRYLHQLKL